MIGRRFRWRRVAFALAASLALGLASATPADSVAVPEPALKAVLFFKLPQFVYRADGDRSPPPGLCLLGGGPLHQALERLARASADGRPTRYRAIASLDTSADCDFLFIGRAEAASLDVHLRRLAGRDLVTVSDIDGFARAGGMVEFALRRDGEGVQILINRKAAQRQGVEFNAQLLRLARIVEP